MTHPYCFTLCLVWRVDCPLFTFLLASWLYMHAFIFNLFFWERGWGCGLWKQIVQKFRTCSTKSSNCCFVVVVFVICRFVSKPAGLSHEKNLVRLTRKVWWPSTSWNLDWKNEATARRRACGAACEIHAPHFSTRPFIRRRRAVGTSPDHVVHLVSDGESIVPESPPPATLGDTHPNWLYPIVCIPNANSYSYTLCIPQATCIRLIPTSIFYGRVVGIQFLSTTQNLPP